MYKRVFKQKLRPNNMLKIAYFLKKKAV